MEAIIRLIIGLGILIFIHELGHFILAKLVGIRVERFSLGFPPRIFGKKIGDTDYCISWIPLGGYVKMSGMIDESMEADSIKGEPWEFMSKPIYQRFLVIFAGPAMNILLAVFVFGAIAYFIGLKEPLGVMVGGIKSQNVLNVTKLQPGDLIVAINNQATTTLGDFEEQIKAPTKEMAFTVERDGQNITTHFPASLIDSIEISLPPVIGSFQEDLPAKESGLQIGDRIVAINGIPVKTWNELTEIIHGSPGQSLHIKWMRNGILDSTQLVAGKKDLQGKEIGLIGIGYPVLEKEINLVQAVGYGFSYSWHITRLIGQSIKMIASGEQKIKEAFAGPIMIAKLAKDSAREGESNFIAFIAFLSLNLGLLNLLPIPVLDGGHIVFLGIEAIIRRPISTKVKLVVQQIGMVLIITLMLFIIYNDIRRLW
jgi:regulator of sigma E protease